MDDEGSSSFSNMYSFETPLRDQGSGSSAPVLRPADRGTSESARGFGTPFRHPLEQTSTPYRRTRRMEDSYSISDLLERQNGLILELLGEQKKFSSSLELPPLGTSLGAVETWHFPPWRSQLEREHVEVSRDLAIHQQNGCGPFLQCNGSWRTRISVKEQG